MSHDEKAMVEAHKAGQLLAWSVAAGTTILDSVNSSVVQMAAAKYKTTDERIAFISGFFQEKKRTAMRVTP